MSRARFLDYSVVVTGASSGIGAATALAFAREGARVTLVGRRAERLAQLEARIAAEGGRAVACAADITRPEGVEALTRAALGWIGRVDILVNNAGVLVSGPLETLDQAEIRRMFETNVFALLACTRAVLPRMRERGTGHIVNISSVAGYVTVPALGAYSATKHAVQALSKALRLELEPAGIRVTTVCPGPIVSELGQLGADRPLPRATVFRPSAEYCAAVILRAVRANSREVFVPPLLALAPLADLLAPEALVRAARFFRGR